MRALQTNLVVEVDKRVWEKISLMEVSIERGLTVQTWPPLTLWYQLTRSGGGLEWTRQSK